MKKIFMLTLVGAMLVSFSSMASGSEKYRISDESVEALFASTTIISNAVVSVDSELAMFSGKGVAAEKNSLVAIILAMPWLIGGLGIHRMYLGSKAIVMIGYWLTCGGIGGLMPLIDTIVLAINYDDISKYIGNNKFFMW